MIRINVNSEFNDLINKIISDKSPVVIVTHVNPDGDALGSSIGLCHVLSDAGADVSIIYPNSFPDLVYQLTDGIRYSVYETDEHLCDELLDKSEYIFCLDFNDSKRVGKMQARLEKRSAKLIMIDHHPDPLMVVDWQISETAACSTAELVTAFIYRVGLEQFISAKAAESLLLGIIADTGSFSHNASNPDLYFTVGELIRHGADKERIHQALFANNTVMRMRLLGYCLSEKMEVLPDYKSAIITLTREELERFEFQPGDTEGFVNYPLSISGIVFSAFFVEKEDKIKISFRSKGNFPANKVSMDHFMGGGHRNAAGGEFRGTLSEATAKFKEVLVHYSPQSYE